MFPRLISIAFSVDSIFASFSFWAFCSSIRSSISVFLRFSTLLFIICSQILGINLHEFTFGELWHLQIKLKIIVIEKKKLISFKFLNWAENCSYLRFETTSSTCIFPVSCLKLRIAVLWLLNLKINYKQEGLSSYNLFCQFSCLLSQTGKSKELFNFEISKKRVISL